MGTSQSAVIKIDLNRSNAFYIGGETLTGNVLFQNVQNKLIIEEIHVQLIGELGYPMQQTRWNRDIKGRSHKQHYIDYHRIKFLEILVSLPGSISGQKKLSLRSGSYSIPFEISLPDYLPPTIVATSAAQGFVKYYIQIMLDKPWSSIDVIPTYSLLVCPRVNLSHMRSAVTSVNFNNQNRQKIKLHGSLLRGGILSGQYLSIEIDLKNPKQCEIKRIKATFIQHRQIASIRDQQTIFLCDLPGIYKFREPILKQNFDLNIPSTYLPPTYEFTRTSDNDSCSIFIYYELVLEVKTNGIFTDFQVNIPVIVGTESVSDTSQSQGVKNQTGVSESARSVSDHNDLPPSYELVMRNELN